MNLVVADFESFFNRKAGYSLDRMTTESYVRDQQFEAHGCAIKLTADKSAFWVSRQHLAAVFARINWNETFLVCHHSHFDGLILSHHYGIRPRMWGCTLSMARLLLGNHVRVGLEALRLHFGMPGKNTPYNLFEGKHWNEMSPGLQQMVGAGACDEVESIWKIFQIFARDFPAEEFGVVDSVIRMFIEPALRADTEMLGQLWQAESIRKQNGMNELGVTEEDLQSSDRFADLLREEGIEPGMKAGKPHADGREKLIYAFAKTDQFMRDLLEHDADRVRLLAETRLGVKSTILQTRAETLGWMASRGPLCVYLNYAGAGTLRPTGSDGANFLNMKRQSPIRKSLLAPDGYVLGPVDASQIEFRCLQWLAGGPDAPALQRLRNGEDPYVGTASKFYQEPIYKPPKGDPRKDEMEAKRGMGKQGELMCGYGASGKQFKITARNGTYGPPIDMSIEDADTFVRLWRADNPRITHRVTGYWAQCEHALKVLANGATLQMGPLLLKMHKIYLPNGAMMNYDTLEWHVPAPDEQCRDFERQGYWRMKTRQGWKKMWGSKLTQNCLSADVKVLTSNGWKAIINVALADQVFDGEQFVSHQGVIARGEQRTMSFEGLRMTPDHLVWTEHGWIRAALAQGLCRPTVHLPHGIEGCGQYGKKTSLASTLRVRTSDRQAGSGSEISSILRLQTQRTDWPQTNSARVIPPSASRGLGFNAWSMQPSKSPRFQKLRKAWNQGLQTLASFREFLERYGSNVRDWINARSKEKRSRLLEGQLLLVGSDYSGAESTFESSDRNALGRNDRIRSSRTHRFEGCNVGVSSQARLAAEGLVREAELFEPTYDIVECGPLNRFVVLGENNPFIVHNCCEAVSRVIVSQAMLRIKRMGFRTLNWPYDELLLLLPKDGREEENLERCMVEMRREVEWLPGLPLDCEGSVSERYSK